MVEVFKTNVRQQSDAEWIAREVMALLPGSTANFDLLDCDHILRVKLDAGIIFPKLIIDCLSNMGFTAAVLPDIVPGVFLQHHTSPALRQCEHYKLG